jgi:hypothetical protein
MIQDARSHEINILYIYNQTSMSNFSGTGTRTGTRAKSREKILSGNKNNTNIYWCTISDNTLSSAEPLLEPFEINL